MTGPIDLLVCGNGPWSAHIATTLSAAVRATTSYRLRLTVGATDIGDDDRARIQRAVPDHPISWIEVPLSLLDALPERKASKFNFIELFAIEQLPVEMERVLTIDADAFVRADLGPLWETDLDGHVLAAARCTWGLWIGRGIANHDELGLDGNRPYLQSGVKVIDLPAWRRARVHERAMAHLERWHDTMALGDQEMLNAVIDGDWVEIPLRWNATTNQTIPEELQPLAFSRRDLHDAEVDPAIVHFAGHKPWEWNHPIRSQLPWLTDWEAAAFEGPYRDWYIAERERGLAERAAIRPQRRSPLRRLRKAASVLRHG